MKRKEPSGWGDALPASDGPDDLDEDDEDEEPAPVRAAKASSVARDEDEEDEEDEEDDEEDDDDQPVSTKKSAAADPDVEAEFEAGKLKKVRQEPKE